MAGTLQAWGHVAGCLAGAVVVSAAPVRPSPLPTVNPLKSYAVVASEAVVADAAWMQVVTTLRQTYDGALITYPAGRVGDTVDALRQLRPRYAAFVTLPTECGRDVVVAVHRAMRTLDDDPYTDVRWGIVTGYDAADALRIVQRREPLLVGSAASSMGPGAFDGLRHGFASSETNAHEFWIKTVDGETEKRDVSPDPIKHLAEAFNAQAPDVFQTSGHATERDWQVGYTMPAGSFRCDNGQLYGLSTDGTRYDISSPHPKIYMPMGNCLIGHIPGKDCMATAWMHTGGVYQMFGYTAVTFHGYMGWGIGTYFGNQYSLAEAFYANSQALVWDLQQSFPDSAGINFDDYDQNAIGQQAEKYGITDGKLLGHLWDRDVVVLYGDPAWEARMPLTDLAWTVSYTHEGENVDVSIRVLKDGTWGDRPLAIPFPERLGGIRGVSCTHDLVPLVTDDVALLPVMGQERVAGDVIRLRFGAHTLEDPPTAADAEPIRIAAVGGAGHRGAEDVKLADDLGPGIHRALQQAGENRGELIKAIHDSEGAARDDMAFLIANLPPRDLQSLDAAFLQQHVAYARRAYEEAPWRERITPELYRDGILPFASVSEKRELWRQEFYERLQPIVDGIATPGEAAIKLNTTIFPLFKVQYHATKRPRPDQGPLESIEAGYASCTGLSILLINACRAVGVPARLAGVAQWTGRPGNHTWVEIWDDGWHCIGAAESKALDDVWFGAGAAAADESDPWRRVYAVSFSRSPLRFPLAWDPYDTSACAVDVTAWYKQRFAGTTAAATPAAVCAAPAAPSEAAETPPVAPVEARNVALEHAQSYVCYRASEAVVVDGNIDKPVWQSIPWTEDFGDILGGQRPTPRFRTRAKMMWDHDCFYVAAELTEPHIWGTITEKNAVIFHDNDFEVFIDPDGDNHAYYEFEMNALNTLWELTLPIPYRAGGTPENGTNLPGLQSAVRIDGTLNDASDTDRRWCVEIAFPFHAMQRYTGKDTESGTPDPGDVWRVTMSRVEWLVDIIDGAYVKVPGRPEDNWLWTPQPAVDAHRPWSWGYVTFADGAPGTALPFHDEAWHVKMFLMDIYDAQRERPAPATSVAELGLASVTVPGLVDDVVVETTPEGWQASARARHADGSTVIWNTRQDSKLWRD